MPLPGKEQGKTLKIQYQEVGMFVFSRCPGNLEEEKTKKFRFSAGDGREIRRPCGIIIENAFPNRRPLISCGK